jgi:hypothetical protein
MEQEKTAKTYTLESIGKEVDELGKKQVELVNAIETMNTKSNQIWRGTVGMQMIAFGGGIGGTLVATSYALRHLNPSVLEWFGYIVILVGLVYGVYIAKGGERTKPRQR